MRVNNNLKPSERELVKMAKYFKKRSQDLIARGTLSPEHRKVEDAVDRFVSHLENHADSRAAILARHEELKRMVRDNAQCPSCHSADMLKHVGMEPNEKGWMSNRYKCRKCNIAFTWNRPNNPWDMIRYFEDVLTMLRLKSADATMVGEERSQIEVGIEQLEKHLGELKPVIEAHDREWENYLEREAEMEKLVHDLKATLLMEKIKLESWGN